METRSLLLQMNRLVLYVTQNLVNCCTAVRDIALGKACNNLIILNDTRKNSSEFALFRRS